MSHIKIRQTYYVLVNVIQKKIPYTHTTIIVLLYGKTLDDSA